MKNKSSQFVSRRNFLKVAAATITALSVDWNQLEVLAADIGSKSTFPVIVIGGGLGGLCAAAYLASNDFPVTLVEQHNIPGGYATTFSRHGGKYTFDVSLHATMSAEGGLRSVFEGADMLGKVETVELPELCRIITPDHDLIWPQRNSGAIINQLSMLFPDQTVGIQGFFAEIMGVLDEAMKPFDPDSLFQKLFFPLSHSKMWSIRNQTLADLLDKYTRNPKLQSLLSVYWPYYGLPPSRLSGFYYAIATASFIRFGGHYIKQRSQDLSGVLAEVIENRGGRVLLGAAAKEITLKDQSVTGVLLEDGQYLNAKAVISNASVPSTMKMLSTNKAEDSYPRKVGDYLNRIETFRPSLSSFVVWLGLKNEVQDKVKEYEIWISLNQDPELAYQGCLDCNPTDASLILTIYDNAYKGYSTPGTSTLSIMMLSGYEPWRRFESDYFAGRKAAYGKEKERIAKTLVRLVEQSAIPGLSSMIEVMEVATPLTNLRYTRNPEGAIYGYEQSLDNAFMTRLENRTPFKGLYLASAWTKPGGGYQPCLQSGANAFRDLLKDCKDIFR